jgi:hypothetical protein
MSAVRNWLEEIGLAQYGVTTRKCSECTTSWTKHERAARWYGRSTLDGCRSGGGRSHVSDVPAAELGGCQKPTCAFAFRSVESPLKHADEAIVDEPQEAE